MAEPERLDQPILPALRGGWPDPKWILENLREGVAHFDASGVCRWANRAYRRMFPVGEARDPVTWDRFIHPEDRGKVRDAARDAEDGYFECEVRCQLTDGSLLVVRLRVFAFPAAEPPSRNFIVFVEDMTEWKETEAAQELLTAEMARSNAELDQFAAIAAHDLQEPARKVLAFSELLEKDLGTEIPERAARDIGFITDAARRLQNLVQDLLSLSRAGRSEMRRERVRLDDCVDEALSDLELVIGARGARIERDPLPEVVGDATLLTQLYHNLIGNGLKFSEDRPVVRITCAPTPEGVVLGVEDEGLGIDPKYAELVFQPFKRLHGRYAYDGTGIGLAICKKAVERHGGRIWLEEGSGKGARFRFILPGARRGGEP